MVYLKLKNKTLGNCTGFKKASGAGIDWGKLDCVIEDVSRLQYFGNDSAGDFISVIPIGNEENEYILTAIDDTNDDDYAEDSAEIIDQDAYETLKTEIETVKSSLTSE